MLTTGTRIRDYKILSKIGEGGMGEVYLAEDENLMRKVAIKVLAPELSRNKELIDRFIQEARLQASLIHPNIVTLFSFFVEQNTFMMVQEYAEGNTLKDIINNQGVISEKESIAILSQILEGLGYAHQKGIVHRDIKPKNIIVDGNGNVKIMDFGIAKALGDKGLTKTGTKMGTVYYMSPEQIKAAKDIDQRTDIYSLGITFYEMLTGRIPFNSNTESDFEVMNEIINGSLQDPRIINKEISEKSVLVLRKMTSKSRDERYRTCYLVGQELGNKGETIEAEQTSTQPKSELSTPKTETSKPIVKRRFTAIKIFAALILLIISSVIVLYQMQMTDEVLIGNQIWMTENLNVDRFRNGDIIPEAKSKGEWEKAGENGQPAWCYYDNDPTNGNKYGKLYNWYAVNNARGLAPEGWHIPTKEEFEKLESAVNYNSNALKLVGQGTGKGAGTNKSGFSALLAGDRDFSGNFDLGNDISFWSSTEYVSYNANDSSLYYSSINVNSYMYRDFKGYGFSVRCVKN